MPKTHTQTVVEAVVGIMNDPTATVDEKLKAAHLFQSFQTLEPKKRRRGRPTRVEADKARMASMFGVSQS